MCTYLCFCDIFGYHIWLQSDAAFYYPSISTALVWECFALCDVTRRPLGRLATASSLEGNVSRRGERGLVESVLGKFDGTYRRYMRDTIEIKWTLLTDDLALHNGNLI